MRFDFLVHPGPWSTKTEPTWSVRRRPRRMNTKLILKLLLLFTIIPLVELALLIYLSTLISFLPTLGIIIGTALAGAILGKFEGMRAWREIQRDLREMRMPTDSLLDGLAVLIAGVLMITPGVLTDIFAIFLLIPPLRRPLREYAKRRLKEGMEAGTVTFITDGGHQGPSPFGPGAAGFPFDSPFQRPGRGEEMIDITPDRDDPSRR